MQDKADPFNQVTGTTGLIGAADTTLILQKTMRSLDEATLIAIGRDIEYQEIVLRFAGLEWQVVKHLTAA